ncbi:hypothetical protein [Streptacidiphilus carbonis]|uniref:hypothetical protein n=1 Tax=Streptacidiphilus carbonis TaxID=105422 RepID=UPI000AB17470|nr:hypothetical protein [Streptacidiphilus carbonis]
MHVTRRFARDVHRHGRADQVLLDWDMGDLDDLEREELADDINEVPLRSDEPET